MLHNTMHALSTRCALIQSFAADDSSRFLLKKMQKPLMSFGDFVLFMNWVCHTEDGEPIL